VARGDTDSILQKRTLDDITPSAAAAAAAPTLEQEEPAVKRQRVGGAGSGSAMGQEHNTGGGAGKGGASAGSSKPSSSKIITTDAADPTKQQRLFKAPRVSPTANGNTSVSPSTASALKGQLKLQPQQHRAPAAAAAAGLATIAASDGSGQLPNPGHSNQAMGRLLNSRGMPQVTPPRVKPQQQSGAGMGSGLCGGNSRTGTGGSGANNDSSRGGRGRGSRGTAGRSRGRTGNVYSSTHVSSTPSGPLLSWLQGGRTQQQPPQHQQQQGRMQSPAGINRGADEWQGMGQATAASLLHQAGPTHTAAPTAAAAAAVDGDDVIVIDD